MEVRKPSIDASIKYLSDRIETIVRLAKVFEPSSHDVSYKPYTLSKLVAVRSIASRFLMVAKGEKAISANYDGAIYLDLYAGGGLTVTRGKRGSKLRAVVGSPFAATVEQEGNREFDMAIFIESNEERARLLKSRVGQMGLQDKFHVIEGNCNKKIGEAVKLIEEKFEKPLIFALGDQEGMETDWRTYRYLSSKYLGVDYLVNISSGSERVYGALKKGNLGYVKAICTSLGKTPEELKEILDVEMNDLNSKGTYRSLLNKQFEDSIGKEKGQAFPIYSRKNTPVYHLGYYTRNTLTGSDWVKSVNWIAYHLENVTGQDAETALNKCFEQQTLKFDTE
ncbi:hypothetical protein IX51_04740 [uncultured archaeon]|nr:hypothetical protein IX51_04740 [uncultured archaeon]